MSTPNGGKVRKLQRAVITFAVVLGLAVVGLFAHRSTQAWERDLDRSLQSVHSTR